MTTRRRFILSTLAIAGALGVGWSLQPIRQRQTPGLPLTVADGQRALNGWVKIGTDNVVTVMMARSEMGQGTHTGLAMLLAEELDADWAQIRIENAPIDSLYANVASVVDSLPFHPDDESGLKHGAQWMVGKLMREMGLMMTGGSSSVKDLWGPMREAGAAARALLVAAAAQRWQVSPAECRVERGRVLHGTTHTATFGELVMDAAKLGVPPVVRVKDPKDFTLIGKDTARLDTPAKSDGSARFGIDAAPEGLLHACVQHCPTRGGYVMAMDPAEAMALPGIKKVLIVKPHAGGTGGVAVIATSWWQAQRAAKAVKVQWHHGPAAHHDSAAFHEQLVKTLDESAGHTYFKRGDVEQALTGAARTISADYHAPMLAHAPMEPMNCTVQIKDGRATVWAATQVPDLARRAVSQVSGLANENIDLRVTLLGGGFGRRLEVDVIGQATDIAMAAGGTPVKTIWRREDDIQHDFYRPPAVSRFRAGLDAQGRLLAWDNQSAGPSIVQDVLQRLFGLPGAGPDKTTSEGAFDQAYEFPAERIRHAIVPQPLPVGFWRSVGHSHQAFFKESFVDEVAHAAGMDPVAFRLSWLKQHPRHTAVLKRAAELARWDLAPANAPDGARVARGVALHESFGSIVAQVAEVSVAADKTIRVHRVVCVIDCGTAVNPNLIRQQMESAIVFGLSAALHGEITVVKGQIQQSNFGDVPLLRMSAAPAVETDIIASTAHPEGVGEPGTPPIAPAVANALFVLTQQRLRRLPLKLA